MIILLCVLCLNKTLCQSYIAIPSLFCSTVPSLQQPYLHTRTKNVIFNSHYAIDKFTKEFSWGKLDNFSILPQKTVILSMSEVVLGVIGWREGMKAIGVFSPSIPRKEER